MNNDIFQRISIPKPCHEDWNQMTPDQKGAFCSVCNKSVHDFSRKSAEEVEKILLQEEEGKICGRFSTSQIQVPSDLEIPFNLLPRNISPFRAFALAVFLVFGTTLFGLTDTFGQTLTGKVCVRPPEPVTTVPAPESERHKTMGMVKRLPEPPKEKEHMVKGDTVYRPDTARPEQIRTDVLGGVVRTVTHAETIMPTPAITQLPPSPEVSTLPRQENMVVGDIAFTPSKPEPELCMVGQMVVIPPDTTLSPKSDPIPEKGIDSVLTENALAVDEKQIPAEKENLPAVTCFPNPSSGSVTLNYSVPFRSDVSAQILDLKGKVVKSLFQIPGHYTGIYSVGLDLSDLPDGIYLVRIQIGGKVITTRVILNK